MQVNTVIFLPQFELLLSGAPMPLAIESIATEETDLSEEQYHKSRKSWLRHLTKEATTSLTQAQNLYQSNFNNLLLLPRQ